MFSINHTTVYFCLENLYYTQEVHSIHYIFLSTSLKGSSAEFYMWNGWNRLYKSAHSVIWNTTWTIGDLIIAKGNLPHCVSVACVSLPDRWYWSRCSRGFPCSRGSSSWGRSQAYQAVGCHQSSALNRQTGGGPLNTAPHVETNMTPYIHMCFLREKKRKFQLFCILTITARNKQALKQCCSFPLHERLSWVNKQQEMILNLWVKPLGWN